MNTGRHIRTLSVFVLAMIALILSAAAPHAASKKTTVPLSIKKIFFEYNSTASALGLVTIEQ